MHRFSYRSFCSLIAVLFTLTAVSQTVTDDSQYRQQQAAARKDAQRARQAEREQNVREANIDSEVAEEAAQYFKELARVQKHNNKVADYMTRDIAHRIVVWGQGGVATRTELLGLKGAGSFSLSGAGAVGLGYQLRHNKFLFTTGAEFLSMNYTYTSAYDPIVPTTVTPYHLGYVNVPLLFGMELPSWYWQAGLKPGYAVMQLGGGTVPPLRVATGAEFGIQFDRWSRPKLAAGQEMTPQQRTQFRMHYKLAVFAEYGLFDFRSVGSTAWNKEDVTLGVKFSAAYQFRRKQKTMEPLPSRPRPAFTFEVRDTEGRPVANAVVAMHDIISGGTSHATTLNDGRATLAAARGEYDIRAYHNGKMAEQLHVQHLSLEGETVTLTLDRDDDTPAEVRIVDEEEVVIPADAPCLVGRVCDSETGAPLQAMVRFGNWIDTTALYRGDANSRGVYVTRLHRGDYSVRVRKSGYMPVSDVIHFEEDSVMFRLKPIKVGLAAKVKDVFFVDDRATLTPESESALASLALFLRQNPDVCIRLTAHTDNQGDEDRLIRLSLARARMIRRNLVTRGIDLNRIEIDGKGGTVPVADNSTEYGRSLNRRIVMEITSVTGPVAPTEE